MANVVKPKLTDINNNITIKEYKYNIDSTPQESVGLISYVDDSLKDIFQSKDPVTEEPLKEGMIESHLQQFHIFEDVDDVPGVAGTSEKLDESSSSEEVVPENNTPTAADNDISTKGIEDTINSNSEEVAPDDNALTIEENDISKKSTEELAKEVMSGKYGVGQARKDALGDRYDEVQKKVNELVYGPKNNNNTPTPTPSSNNEEKPKPSSTSNSIKDKSTEELAKEVMNGKYGSGQARKDALGDRYDEVQKKVNELLYGSPKPSNQSQNNESKPNNNNNNNSNNSQKSSDYTTTSKTINSPRGKRKVYGGYNIDNYPTASVYNDPDAAFTRAVIAANYLYKHSNLSKEQAAAVAGVMLDENGCQPKAVCKKDNGAGIYSWTYDDYKNQCLKDAGFAPYTPIENLSFRQQCDVIVAMSNKSQKYYFNSLRRCNTIEDASYTAIVMAGGVAQTNHIKQSWKNSHPNKADALDIQDIYIKTNGKSDYTLNMVEHRLQNAKDIYAAM